MEPLVTAAFQQTRAGAAGAEWSLRLMPLAGNLCSIPLPEVQMVLLLAAALSETALATFTVWQKMVGPPVTDMATPVASSSSSIRRGTRRCSTRSLTEPTEAIPSGD